MTHVAQCYGSQTKMPLLKLKHLKKVTQTTKVKNTLKGQYIQTRETNVNEMKIPNVFVGIIVGSSNRNIMNKSMFTGFNPKYSSRNINLLRMYGTKTRRSSYDNSDKLNEYIKVTNRSQVTAILTNKLKSYKSDDNKIHNINNIFRDTYF